MDITRACLGRTEVLEPGIRALGQCSSTQKPGALRQEKETRKGRTASRKREGRELAVGVEEKGGGEDKG